MLATTADARAALPLETAFVSRAPSLASPTSTDHEAQKSRHLHVVEETAYYSRLLLHSTLSGRSEALTGRRWVELPWYPRQMLTPGIAGMPKGECRTYDGARAVESRNGAYPCPDDGPDIWACYVRPCASGNGQNAKASYCSWDNQCPGTELSGQRTRGLGVSRAGATCSAGEGCPHLLTETISPPVPRRPTLCLLRPFGDAETREGGDGRQTSPPGDRGQTAQVTRVPDVGEDA